MRMDVVSAVGRQKRRDAQGPMVMVSILTVAVILAFTGRASSTTMTVDNIGSIPVTFVNANFDIAPFPAVCSDLDFQLFSSTGDPRDSGLFRVPFDDAHPLLPGEHRTSFRIPALTGVDFNYIGGGLGSFGQASISESRGCVPIHVSIAPPTTNRSIGPRLSIGG